MTKWKRLPALQEQILFDKLKSRPSEVNFSTQAATRALLGLEKKGLLKFVHRDLAGWEATEAGRQYLVIWERVTL